MDNVAQRSEELFTAHQQEVYRRTDRLFAVLLVCQWVFAIGVALVFSPYSWRGKVHNIHLHVQMAIVLGGVITSLPVYLALKRPGEPVTRYVIAVAQMLWSALLIHLTGGRIETHFHVFGSLAFLAFYRDWRVLVPATIVVAADHFIRQQLWPESVFGIINPEWWRFLEHAFWVVFEDIVLIMSCIVATREMRQIANVRAEVEALSVSERNKSQALDGAMAELRASQEARVRTEKLAAVGQLAASVGHELRNPLAAVRSALAYVGKRVGEKSDAIGDAKVAQFLTLADRELQASFKIISDLLDFARERPPSLSPCPLHPLVEDVLTLVPKSSVRVVNEVPIDLPVPSLDKDQCRQLLANLVQNAMEAIPSGQAGEVIIRAEGGGDRPLRISVRDNGPGMEQAIIDKIFEPLFTTKSKGTGLGLAIVASVVRRHGGTIRVDSAPGQGSTFIIELPQVVRQQAA